MDAVSATVTIRNELGMHAKPAMAFTQLATKFASDVRVSRTDTGDPVDGKSMLAMLTLMLTRGTEIEIRASGNDADRAVAKLVALVEASFGPDGTREPLAHDEGGA